MTTLRPLAALAALSAMTATAATARPASFADFDRRAREGADLTVVFFGGSLTWSANASEPNQTGFRGLMADYLLATYPKSRFRFHDAAIGGSGSFLGIFRLERDVLAHKPDLVFLDFACNDGGENTDLAPTCCYESLLRRMIAQGIPVVQMFFTFRFWAEQPDNIEGVHPRLIPYRRLAEAYATGVGDIYRDTSLLPDLREGRRTADELWPIDGGHPGDLGYRYFADAGIRGLQRAIAEELVCRVPERPVFGTVEDVVRWNPALEGPLPSGWSRRLTYRTSLWFDGLSSRWMDDVAAFSGTGRSPLEVRARGNFVGVFGEADEKAVVCEVRVDGQRVAEFPGYHGAGTGRLFIWRSTLLDGWQRGESREHTFTFDPIPSADGSGEFHIGSICTATLVPSAVAEQDPSASPDNAALEAIDHARGN